MAFKIADADEFEPLEIIGLVQRVLEIGIAADRVEGGVFVDFCTLGCNGPGHFAVESRRDLSAVDTRELEESLERLRVVDESRLVRSWIERSRWPASHRGPVCSGREPVLPL